MARPRRRALQPSDIEGLEYFDTLVPLLAQLKDIGTQRDRAGNRQLFYDQYVCLLLLYFFSPTITSLRALQQASTLEAVQRRLGIRATSLGSFSEAARLFDAKALHQILQELAAKAAPLVNGPNAHQLLDLTAVDGSIFRAFPRMAWALWKDSEHRGVKLHLHFDVFCVGNPGNPVSVHHSQGKSGVSSSFSGEIRCQFIILRGNPVSVHHSQGEIRCQFIILRGNPVSVHRGNPVSVHRGNPVSVHRGNPVSVHRGNPVSVHRGNPVSVHRGNPVSVHHSQGKSGVSSSFLPEKTN